MYCDFFSPKNQAMVEELIKSVEASGEVNQESSILVRKKTSGILLVHNITHMAF